MNSCNSFSIEDQLKLNLKIINTNCGPVYLKDSFTVYRLEDGSEIFKSNYKIVDIYPTISGNLGCIFIWKKIQYIEIDVGSSEESTYLYDDCIITTSNHKYIYQFKRPSQPENNENESKSDTPENQQLKVEILSINKSSRKVTVAGNMDLEIIKIFAHKKFLYGISNNYIKTYSCLNDKVFERCKLIQINDEVNNIEHIDDLLKDLQDHHRIEMTDEYIFKINLNDQNYEKYSKEKIFDGQKIPKNIYKHENKWYFY